MSIKKLSTALESDTQNNQTSGEIALDAITEEYKKLNDKIDKAISRIKHRKGKKKEK
jgi:hypothetical protein